MTSAITNVTGAAGVHAAADVAANGLSADSVLNYCASRLDAIDTVIQKRLAEQQTRNEALKQYSRFMDILRRSTNGQAEHAGAKGAANGDHGAHHIQQAVDLRSLYNDAADPRLREAIQAEYTHITGKPLEPGPDGKVAPGTEPPLSGEALLDRPKIVGSSREQWDARVASHKTNQDALSKDNEMAMIQLQSMLSQRQLAVQMTTQMLSAMAEANKGIVANIRA